ncbi:P-loop containing nucleoside triphosphate hydrolase protein [Mycena rebaudengoi]|nr:P-loop containing nucleoside triphosphate hydrolase protein [Mycena rebaudengoi]
MHLDSVVKYTTLAATTAQEIASIYSVPFLASAATLTSSILKCVESMKVNQDECVEIVQQIHEILCTVVKLSTATEVNGVPPTALLYDIAQFTETLQKIFTSLKAQQSMGKIRKFFTQASNTTRLEAHCLELNRALEISRAQAGGSVVSQMSQIQKDAKEQHEELVALLAAHQDPTNSDHSSVIGSLSSSLASLLILPPTPKIFHGRETELHDIVNLLLQDSPRIAVLGAGGIGKTSLAAAALHHPKVEAKYSQQYFIGCHSTPTCVELVATIADHIGVEKGPNLSKRIMHYFTNSSTYLLVLDNFETPWESLRSRPAVEEFLSLLTDIPHLGLMITLRGAERPTKVKWTRPFLAPLSPLSSTAARQIFMDVADDTHDKESVKQLLDLTGNLPLAVSLIANVAASEGCDKALSRWKSESTQMISDGYDQRSSLHISILLSFTSPRMTPGAQDLLSIVSMLPDGFTDSELVKSKLPISNILACKATLIQTSLAFIDKEQRLKVLVPVREHILSIHPPKNTLKLRLRKNFHDLLNLWDRFQTLKIQEIVLQISQNLGNLNSVLSESLSTECSDSVQNYQSILNLNRFCIKIQQTFSPLLVDLAAPMAHVENHSIFGDYLIECFDSCFALPVKNPEVQIALRNQYFQTRDVLQQGES